MSETKTVVSVNLSATFDTLDEALEFVSTVKEAGIENFNISQYQRYQGDLEFEPTR